MRDVKKLLIRGIHWPCVSLRSAAQVVLHQAETANSTAIMNTRVFPCFVKAVGIDSERRGDFFRGN